MRPSKLTNEIFLYVLAVAATRHGIDVHAFCVMSNHYHLLVTDPGARLPAFVQYLDMLVARATNASLGRWDGFWESTRSYSAVEPVSPDDIVAKTAYVLANPVAAGLVHAAREWPGLWTGPEQLGSARLEAARPKVFFRDDGEMPASSGLALVTPPGFAAAEYRALVAAEVSGLEAESGRELAREGRGFLGRARVLAQKPFARPAPGDPRRQLNPRIACRDKWKRVEALSRVTAFVLEHRDARLAFWAGIRDVVFPAGTYLLRITQGVRCAPAG